MNPDVSLKMGGSDVNGCLNSFLVPIFICNIAKNVGVPWLFFYTRRGASVFLNPLNLDNHNSERIWSKEDKHAYRAIESTGMGQWKIWAG